MQLWNVIQAFILGCVQGLTEFIPVSSSGHLIIVGHLLNFPYSSLGFDIALDIGTLAALLIFFRHDIKELLIGLVKKTDHTRLSWMMAAATVPAVLAGVLLQPIVETTLRSTQIVAANLILVAFVMLAADRFAKRKLELTDMSFGRAISIGCAQAIALIPGVSRSGITISAGLFAGLTGPAATRFSFLLSAPVIFGATAKVMLKPENMHQLLSEPVIYAAGILGAFISGYFAIRFMLRYLAKHGLALFAYYRIAVGVLLLMLGIQ
ncbi:undecaprenyl-diphosphate phosphatase [Patescibacteria group bacterium]|nr:MAG: undecaprenyl-diphosphate phosphatase [Patescibacteria group bacterium]